MSSITRYHSQCQVSFAVESSTRTNFLIWMAGYSGSHSLGAVDRSAEETCIGQKAGDKILGQILLFFS